MDGAVQADRYPRRVDSPEAKPVVTPSPSPAVLQEQIDNAVAVSVAGHERLREDLNKALARLSSAESSIIRHNMDLTRIDGDISDAKKAPVPISNINFPLPAVVGIVVFCVVLVSGQVANLAIQAGQSKLQDERALMVKELQDEFRKRATLEDSRQAERAKESATLASSINNLRDIVLGQQRRR